MMVSFVNSRSVRRIAIAFILTWYLYYILSQTQRMSASLFPDYSQYDSPYLPAEASSWSSSSSSSIRSSSSGSAQTKKSQSPLPKWLQDYFSWHIAMRKQYPGDSILTDPNAPGVLVKGCAFKCGGLHDRLGGLGWDLYFANQTKRVLMIHWCIPAPITNFLVPNLVDWTLPYNESSDLLDARLFSNTTEMHIHCDRAVEEFKGLFDGYREYMQGEDFWEKNIDLALDRAIHGNYSHVKILRMKVLGVDDRLAQRLLVRHNETDSIAWRDSFPAMFWTLFKPSEGLQRELDDTFRQLRVSSPFDYNAPPFYAIHARIRHPRGHVGQEVVAKDPNGSPDKFGMAWSGPQKNFAIQVAQHAFECAQKQHLDKHALHIPEYVFYADSEDLVTYMGEEYGVDGMRVRNMTGVEVLHIDRQQGFPPKSYYSAFVDLFVGAQASCIFFGAGNYALLSAKINTRGARQCLIRHYPDSSHELVIGTEFLECNERWDLVPTRLERQISDI